MLFITIGITGILFAYEGSSRTFSTGMRSEAGIMLGVGLALSGAGVVRGLAKGPRVKKLLAMSFTLLISVGVTTYLLTPSIIALGPRPGDSSLKNVKTVLVKVTGGPIYQGANYYVPDTITVIIGVNNSVMWTDVDASHHTVTGPNRIFESGNINPGQTFTYLFAEPGIYQYGCDYHPWMKGTVVVKGDS